MKNLMYLFIVFTCILIACNTEEANMEVSNKDFNKQIVEYLQTKYDVKAEVEFASDFNKRLNKEEIENLEDYFRFIGGLKKQPLKMEPMLQNNQTRAEETKSFSQTLNYEGDNVNVYVYYTMNTNGGLPDSPSIEVGIGGAGNPFAHYQGNSCHNNARYEVYYWDNVTNYSNTRIDVERIRADYILRYYYIVNGVFSDTPYATVKTKLCAYGYVNILNNTGDFHLMYSGDGSWMQTIIDEGLNKHSIH